MDILVDALRDSSLGVTLEASMLLNILTGEDVPTPLLANSTEEQAMQLVLSNALGAVPRIPEVQLAIPALIETVANGSNDLNTRTMATSALGKLGAIEALGTFEQLLSDSNPRLVHTIKINLLAIYSRNKVPLEKQKEFSLP